MRTLSISTSARLLMLAASLLWASSAHQAQTRGTEAIPQLEFARATRTAVVTGSVQLPHGEGDMHNDGADRYSFKYRKGQRLTLDLQSEGRRAVFTITKVDASVPNLPALVTKWSGRLPASGDYQVIILTREGTAQYRLKASLR